MLAKIFVRNTGDGEPTYVAREAFSIGDGEFAAPADGIGRAALFTQKAAREAGFDFTDGEVVHVFSVDNGKAGVEAEVGTEADGGGYFKGGVSTQHLTFKRAKSVPTP